MGLAAALSRAALRRPAVGLLATIAALALIALAVVDLHASALRASEPWSWSPATLGRRPLAPASASRRARVAASYGGLPLAFEANRGQLERQVLYAARGRGYTLALTRRSVLLGMEGGVELAIGMLGARPVRVVPASALEGRVNYLIGRDRSRWRTGIPTFARA